MTDAPRASADGGGSGSAVPMPLDWPDSGSRNGFAVGPRVLRAVAKDLRDTAGDPQPPAFPTGWNNRGAVNSVRALNAEPGVWSTARSVQHVHAQLLEGLSAFHGALIAGLPAVAAKLERTATNYERAEQQNSAAVDHVSSALPTSTAPSVVDENGRF